MYSRDCLKEYNSTSYTLSWTLRQPRILKEVRTVTPKMKPCHTVKQDCLPERVLLTGKQYNMGFRLQHQASKCPVPVYTALRKAFNQMKKWRATGDETPFPFYPTQKPEDYIFWYHCLQMQSGFLQWLCCTSRCSQFDLVNGK